MKRWLVRLSALSVVALVGLLLFAHAKRGAKSPDEAEATPVVRKKSAISPIPISSDTAEGADASNPFANKSRLIVPVEASESAETDAGDRYARLSHNAPTPADEPEVSVQFTESEPDEPQRLDAPSAAPMPGRNPFSKQAAPSSQDAEPNFVEQAGGTQEVSAEEPTTAAELEARSVSEGKQAATPTPSLTRRASQSYGDRYKSASPRPTETEQPAASADRNAFAEPTETAADSSAFAPAPGQPTRTSAAAGNGRPGAKQLDGSQAPSLTIEKTAPAEIQVGKPATFLIRVRNAGQVPAHGVEIHDEVPQGTELVSTKPAAIESDGKLVWQLGTLKPGDEVTAELQVNPQTEGEIGSVARLTFSAEASVRTISTRPQLKVDVDVPHKVMIGTEAAIKIRISNPGTGPATGVVLTEEVPPGFKHPGGTELELEIGTLKPGESRELDLMLAAAQPGTVTNVLKAVGDANLTAEDRDDVEVIAPALKVAVAGPKRRYLQRNAAYTVTVTNPGTAPAKDIELTATLPRGLKFEEANNQGHYDAAAHSVTWSLEELPPGDSGTVTLNTLAVEAGDLKLQVKAQAKQGLSDAIEESIAVEGVAAIFFELVDVSDPIEVGGETSYEIRVINQGSAAASNVRLVALLPPEMKALDADGPVRHTIDGQRVLFEPLGQLAPKADTTYNVKVQASAAGDLRLRVQVVTDQITTPVTKEESTRVYSDE